MPRNIYTEDRDNILLDMAQVEATQMFGPVCPDVGLNWLSRQHLDHQYSFQSAVLTIEERRKSTNWFNCNHCGEIVYGSGGWNRWVIFPDGEVRFSAGHGHDRSKEAAVNLGFVLL